MAEVTSPSTTDPSRSVIRSAAVALSGAGWATASDPARIKIAEIMVTPVARPRERVE